MRDKVILVAEGYSQTEVSSMKHMHQWQDLRLSGFSGIHCTFGLKIYQLNVECSFLNGELVEEFSSTTVLRLWNSKSCGLCISTLQDSQQAQVS